MYRFSFLLFNDAPSTDKSYKDKVENFDTFIIKHTWEVAVKFYSLLTS